MKIMCAKLCTTTTKWGVRLVWGHAALWIDYLVQWYCNVPMLLIDQGSLQIGPQYKSKHIPAVLNDTHQMNFVTHQIQWLTVSFSHLDSVKNTKLHQLNIVLQAFHSLFQSWWSDISLSANNFLSSFSILNAIFEVTVINFGSRWSEDGKFNNELLFWFWWHSMLSRPYH